MHGPGQGGNWGPGIGRAPADGVVIFDRPLLEVAEDLGLTHEAYYRALAMLASAGAIQRMGRTIRLIKSAT